MDYRIDKEDSEFPTLPESNKSEPANQLKRKINELDSIQSNNDIPALEPLFEPPTKRQRIQFSKLLKKMQLIFKRKKKVRNSNKNRNSKSIQNEFKNQ